jgi:hypothetical protein
MYHKISYQSDKKCRRKTAALLVVKRKGKLLAFLVLALLVGNAAAGLASGLARGLALAAAAVLGALAQVLGLQGLNVAHHGTSILVGIYQYGHSNR